MAQLDLAIFFLFFLAKNIPDPSYCRELLLCIACFRSSQRFLVGFRTGLCLKSSDIYLVMLFMAASMVSVCLVLFFFINLERRPVLGDVTVCLSTFCVCS